MSAFICRCMWTRTHLWIFFFVNFANKFWKGKKVFTLSLLDPSVKSALPEFLFSAGWSSRAFRESSFISKCEYLDRNVSEKKVLLMNIAIRETFRKSKTFFFTSCLHRDKSYLIYERSFSSGKALSCGGNMIRRLRLRAIKISLWQSNMYRFILCGHSQTYNHSGSKHDV